MGPQDVTSKATTAGSLAMVRAAQGRDEEADELFKEALATVADTDFLAIQVEILKPFAEYLRARGRDEEAARLEKRRAELWPAPEKSPEPIA